MHIFQATTLLAAGAAALGLLAAPGGAPSPGSISIHPAAVISSPVPNQGAQFGQSVAVNAQDTVMAVGSPEFDYFLGRVNLYRRTGTGWQHTATLKPPDPPRTGPSHTGGTYGVSLAFSAAGSELVVGSDYLGATHTGAVYTYRLDGTVWKLASRLIGQVDYAGFGSSVALTLDGTHLAVEAPFGWSQGVTNSVITYHAGATGWVEDGTILCPTGPSGCSPDPQGSSLAMSSTGNTLVVSSFGATTSQQAGVFARTGGHWAQAVSIPDGDQQGVAMNNAGSVIVAASMEYPVGSGGPRTFIRAYQTTSAGWKQSAILAAPCPESATAQSCYMDGNQIRLNSSGTEVAFSDIFAPVNGSMVGKVYLYSLAGGKFVAQASVSGQTSQRWFGGAIGLDANADTLVVGEPTAYDLQGEVATYTITP